AAYTDVQAAASHGERGEGIIYMLFKPPSGGFGGRRKKNFRTAQFQFFIYTYQTLIYIKLLTPMHGKPEIYQAFILHI
ncbi:MAG: hypothetical protein JW807_09275, partial [Spirochaetes bacterium]|nr:hypothetical protein [Spirochaetota bacterium]